MAAITLAAISSEEIPSETLLSSSLSDPSAAIPSAATTSAAIPSTAIPSSALLSKESAGPSLWNPSPAIISAALSSRQCKTLSPDYYLDILSPSDIDSYLDHCAQRDKDWHDYPTQFDDANRPIFPDLSGEIVGGVFDRSNNNHALAVEVASIDCLTRFITWDGGIRCGGFRSKFFSRCSACWQRKIELDNIETEDKLNDPEWYDQNYPAHGSYEEQQNYLIKRDVKLSLRDRITYPAEMLNHSSLIENIKGNINMKLKLKFLPAC